MRNKELLKSIEQLIKVNSKNIPNKSSKLSNKQLEALRKGRETLAKSKVNKASNSGNKIRNIIDITNLTTGLFSIIKLFKSGIIRIVAFIALIYYKIRSYKIFDFIKVISYLYLIIGLVMLLIFNYNQLEYTTLLINSYESFWDKTYDYLLNLWYRFKDKLFGKSIESMNQMDLWIYGFMDL